MQTLNLQQVGKGDLLPDSQTSYKQNQFLNISFLSNELLQLAWKLSLCEICGLLAANPRQCQGCHALACYECISQYQNDTIKDPAKCFKGCQFIVFQGVSKRDHEFNQYFQSILAALQHSDSTKHSHLIAQSSFPSNCIGNEISQMSKGDVSPINDQGNKIQVECRNLLQGGGGATPQFKFIKQNEQVKQKAPKKDPIKANI